MSYAVQHRGHVRIFGNTILDSFPGCGAQFQITDSIIFEVAEDLVSCMAYRFLIIAQLIDIVIKEGKKAV